MLTNLTKAFFILLLTAFTANATIARVQSKAANTSATNATSLAIVMDSTPTAGNVLVVAMTAGGTSNNDLKMSEQTGITWEVYQFKDGNGARGGIAFGRVFSSIASATIT